MSPEPAAIFAALGDATRLELLSALGAEPMSISALADGRPITRQGVTKHLRVLEAAGLVRSDRTGREVVWWGRREGVAAAQDHLGRIGARWEAALERLKAHVERPG